ncbi:MAG: hypothetical protein M3R35_01035, partial [Candidatus Eremiobacteraeota bacterium]|nr:hypothetical protein [Candidatus Eremiobacteraeota bacterium]
MKRFLLLFSLVSAAGCNPRPAQAPPDAAPSPTPTASSTAMPIRIVGKGSAKQQIVTYQQQGNRRLYELHAKSSVFENTSSQTVAQFKQTTVTFYDKSGSTLIASAPVTTVDQRAKQVVMTGGVHARSSSGMKLVCDRLSYYGKTGMLHGQG